MKAVGFWIRDVFDDEFIHPSEVAGVLSADEASVVLAYLRRGVVVERYRGFSWCRCRCGIESPNMGSCDLSDGEWLWPEGLSHYVEVHRVGLPAEFVARAAGSLDVPSAAATDEEDFMPWIHWCREHRNPGYLAALAEARSVSERQFSAEIAARITRFEEQKGVSAEPCAWIGCGRHALSGMRLCSFHAIGSHERDLARMICARPLDLPQMPNPPTRPASGLAPGGG